jgi:hypothetical protein
MFVRLIEWWRLRRERRLYRQMSRDINRGRRKLAPVILPPSFGRRKDEG